MVLYPAILLTIFSPAFYFPEMGSNSPLASNNTTTSDSENVMAENEYKSVTPEEGMMPSH